jgi:hypothetical protein
MGNKQFRLIYCPNYRLLSVYGKSLSSSEAKEGREEKSVGLVSVYCKLITVN